MKFYLLARSSAFASIVLLHARNINARDDSAKIGRSLDGIFQDPPSQWNDATEEYVIEESSINATESDVAPAIIGGGSATPREYPVSSRAATLCGYQHACNLEW